MLVHPLALSGLPPLPRPGRTPLLRPAPHCCFFPLLYLVPPPTHTHLPTRGWPSRQAQVSPSPPLSLRASALYTFLHTLVTFFFSIHCNFIFHYWWHQRTMYTFCCSLCTQYFLYLHIDILIDPCQIPMQWVLLSLFFRWGNWDSERLFQVTPGNQIQVWGIPETVLLYYVIYYITSHSLCQY